MGWGVRKEKNKRIIERGKKRQNCDIKLVYIISSRVYNINGDTETTTSTRVPPRTLFVLPLVVAVAEMTLFHHRCGGGVGSLAPHI